MIQTTKNVILSIDEFNDLKDIVIYCYTEDYDLIDDDKLVKLHSIMCEIDYD